MQVWDVGKLMRSQSYVNRAVSDLECSIPSLSAYSILASLGLATEDHSMLRFLLHALCLRELQATDPGGRVKIDVEERL